MTERPGGWPHGGAGSNRAAGRLVGGRPGGATQLCDHRGMALLQTSSIDAIKVHCHVYAME